MIGLLINSFLMGGAERVVLTLHREFCAIKPDTLVISIEKGSAFNSEVQSDRYIISSFREIRNPILKLLSIPFQARKLAHLIKTNNIRVIQSHLIRSNIINILAKSFGARHKAILVNHNIISHTKTLNPANILKRIIIKHFYSKADMLLFISEEMKADFEQSLKLNTPNRVIPNPHNIKAIATKAGAIPTFRYTPKYTYLIFFGRLIKRKNVDQLIHAFRNVLNKSKEIKLLILGEGPEYEKLCELQKKYHLEKAVHFLGYQENPFQYIQRADIFILPSNREGLPNSIIEAMACKTAIISSDCSSGPREIIAPVTPVQRKLSRGYELHPFGLLYAVNDTEALTHSIQHLLEHPELIETLKANAYKRALDYDIANVVPKHFQTFNQLNPKP